MSADLDDLRPPAPGSANRRDGAEHVLEVLGADSDESAAEAGGGELAVGDPPAECVDADAVDGGCLLQG